MPPFTTLVSRGAVLPKDDVDTDQIIPARFLTTTERRGLGRHAFADWRDAGVTDWLVSGATIAADRAVLVTGRNFGCGSSREHAPWALADFGFRAIVARSFADIFMGNALKNGLVPVTLSAGAHDALLAALRREPDLPLTVDVEQLQLATPDAAWPFPLPSFSRRCLLDGVDELGYLLAASAEVDRWEASHATREPWRRVNA